MVEVLMKWLPRWRDRRVPLRYHRWYYDSGVWKRTTWEGVQAKKSVLDLWNYQEIIWDLRPSLVLEFGAYRGGSTLWFGRVLDAIGEGQILSVDVDTSRIPTQVRDHARISIVESSSIDTGLIALLREWRSRPDQGPWFVILDSDHSRDHVLAELEAITPILRPGDYVIVEDSNVNGHPVLPDFGPGPFEAIEEFTRREPGAYRRDLAREVKFGFTWAPHGYLIRQ